ncbi:hypothetical protein PHISP_05177 [Aspergillus sp. HF37]|nr:hypothetical protein PHISP_05177 [Aspergillus sp. HF37]
MDPNQAETGNAPGAAEDGLQRQGSVRRAREGLESGERAEALMPPPIEVRPRPPIARNEAAHMTQWPLPDNCDMGPNMVHHQPRHLVPRGPPPPRPRRPSDTPASSIYSERSAPGMTPNPHHVRRPLPSFSQPLPYNPPTYHAAEQPFLNPTNSSRLPSGISATTDEFSRQSAASSVGTIPDFPLPQGPNPAYIHPHQNTRPSTAPRKSSVSPIQEEARDSPTVRGGSFPSSRAIPSSWGSGPAESEILGAYLGDSSGNGHQSELFPQDENGTLVRQASLGKRGKPSLRTIQKSNPSSYLSEEHANRFPGTEKVDANGQRDGNGTSFRESSSVSSDSSHEVDLEKSPAFLDVPQGHPIVKHDVDALEKELEVLPRSGPKMSDKRPGGPRPPRLDMGAVRDAEVRGSLTSLPDLIRRATKLASRLDHGRTASRADVCDDTREIRPPFAQRLRNSASVSDILASFPHPGASEGRSSWPVLFKKSGHRNIRSDDSLSATGEKRQQRCCGMRRRVFAIVSAAVLIVIALAVLLPVFLVAVPQQNAGDKLQCEQTTSCKNGGISVSSDTSCSCVCTNGYTGSQCTVEGDTSCVTTEINGHNATMGSALPRVLEDSEANFSIPLNPFTLMALFSQNDMSCMTENALVSFQGVRSKTRRFFIQPDLSYPAEQHSQTITKENPPTQTPSLAPRDGVATLNGILIDGSAASTTQGPSATATESPTATKIMQNPSSSSTPTTTSTPSPIPRKTVDFARIAVLYIFQQTAALDAAMEFSENIQSFLTAAYSSEHAQKFSMSLRDFGVLATVTVDFTEFSIAMGGTEVGGDSTAGGGSGSGSDSG